MCVKYVLYVLMFVTATVTVLGTFGFQYRTEDGISHAAQGDPTGYIQGSYSYKDPTGLKVNFNYFAGGRNNNQNSASQPQYSQPQYSQPQYSNPEARNTPAQAPQQYYSDPDPYQAPQEYRPRTRPPASYTRSQYQPTYEPRYTQTAPARLNEVYDNNDYSGQYH